MSSVSEEESDSPSPHIDEAEASTITEVVVVYATLFSNTRRHYEEASFRHGPSSIA